MCCNNMGEQFHYLPYLEFQVAFLIRIVNDDPPIAIRTPFRLGSLFITAVNMAGNHVLIFSYYTPAFHSIEIYPDSNLYMLDKSHFNLMTDPN